MKQNSNIDFLIVGAGLYGATIARLLTDKGYTCKIIDRREHIAGNVYTEKLGNIDIHKYGAHIFHTNNDDIINFVKKYSEWIPYIQNTIAIDDENKMYHLPFNCTTYYEMFGTLTPEEAYNKIEREIINYTQKNSSYVENLEQQAINCVGTTIYEKLIKHYTEKQWNKPCSELSPEIIKRLPLRYTFNNNYFNDKFQAIPADGYTNFVKNIIGDIPCILNKEFEYSKWKNKVKYNIIFCGAIDELLDYSLGTLEWRSLHFSERSYISNGHNGQGTAVINYTGANVSYTRTIEHAYFIQSTIQPGTLSVITTETPKNWVKGDERYYPVNNNSTDNLYKKYIDELYKKMPKIIPGGRLGKYKYFDMDDSILEAMIDFEKIIEKIEQ